MDWLSFFTAKRSRNMRYGVAVVAAAVAVGLIAFFEQWKVGSGTVLAFDVAAISFSALFGGFGPALVTAALSVVGIDFFFIAPFFSFMGSVAGFLDLGVDLLFAAAMSAVFAKLRALVTELNRMADLRQQTLNIVAHDLRNPLSGIRLSAGNLKQLEGRLRPGQVEKAAGLIENATYRMDRLIGDLLDSEKVHSGKFSVHPTWANGEELLQEALRSVARPAEAAGVGLRAIIDSDDPRFYGDYGEILRVVSNLLSNAVKFSPRGKVVEARLERGPRTFRIVVSDEGPGIPSEDHGRLFDRYWQAKESAHRGTGLGLFIAAGIVKAHGGTIRVESQPGKGSRFIAEFPLPDVSMPVTLRTGAAQVSLENVERKI